MDIGVSALHTVVGCVLFRDALSAMVRDGILNSVNDEQRKAAFWFLMAGFMMLVIGLLLSHLTVVPLPA